MQKVQSVQRHVQTGDLPPPNGDQKKRVRETDLNDVVREVQNLLPRLLHGNGNTEVNVTLSKGSLKIAADTALMLDAILSLVRHALDVMPDGGRCSLSVGEVGFKTRSILDGDHGSYGMCAFLAVAYTRRRSRANMVQPPCATRTGTGKDGDLSRGYRIIRQHHGSVRKEPVAGQGMRITVYIPLVRLDGTSPGTQSMRSLPEVTHENAYGDLRL